jgi:hypothetical protein
LPITPTDADLDEYLEEQAVLLNGLNEKVILIYDINNSKFIGSEQRIKIGKWSKEKTPLFLEKTYGTCLVNTSVIANIIMKGIFLFTGSQQTPIFSKMEEAIKWADGVLAKNGIVKV